MYPAWCVPWTARPGAVLSDKYKRLDNHEFLMTVFPVLLEAGKRDGMTVDVKSSEITERRMYVQLTFEGLEAEFPVNRQGRQVGEVVKAGLVLKNSEVGYGCREINFLAYTLACTNGMILPAPPWFLHNPPCGRQAGQRLIVRPFAGSAAGGRPRLCLGDP